MLLLSLTLAGSFIVPYEDRWQAEHLVTRTIKKEIWPFPPEDKSSYQEISEYAPNGDACSVKAFEETDDKSLITVEVYCPNQGSDFLWFSVGQSGSKLSIDGYAVVAKG